MSEDLFSKQTWRQKIPAKAVTPGEKKKLFGYAIETDIAQRIPYAAYLYLSIRGELPSLEESRRFEIALFFASTISLEEGATHAALISRLCGAGSPAVHSTAVLGLSQRAARLVESTARLLGRFTGEDVREPPAESVADHIRTALGEDAARTLSWRLPLAAEQLPIALLMEAGITAPLELERAVVMASLPTVLAEAFCGVPGSFQQHSVHIPPIEYVEET